MRHYCKFFFLKEQMLSYILEVKAWNIYKLLYLRRTFTLKNVLASGLQLYQK